MTNLWQDLRHTMRLTMKSPGLTATALLTLTVVIGANTAVFSVVHGVLLKPLPYAEPEQLAAFWNGIARSRSDVLNGNALGELQRSSQSFAAISPLLSFTQVLATDEPAVAHNLARVSWDFFRVILRVRPALGRDFTMDDAQPDAQPVTILSHEFWSTQFGSDPNILGRIIRLRGPPGGQAPGPSNPSGLSSEYSSLQVVGVLPAGLRSPKDLGESPSMWVLVGSGPPIPTTVMFPALGRLKPGVALDQAQAELATIWGPIIEAGGERLAGHGLELMDLAASYGSASDRTATLIFFGAVLSVLLVGILNLVGMELAQLPRFEGELAVRAALGATRWRLVRFMLTKTMVVGLAGGVLGTLIATMTHGILLAYLPSGFPRQLDIRMDWNIWLFSIGLSLLSSLLIAAVPAVRASRPDVLETLNSSNKAYTEDRRHRIFGDAITALQTATALVLLVGAGLLLHSFWRLTSVDMGFEPTGVVVLEVTLPDSYQDVQLKSFVDDTVDRFGTMTSVEAGAIAHALPMFLIRFGWATAVDAGPQGSLSDSSVQTTVDELLAAGYLRVRDYGVSSGYFETLRIPMLAGRTFTAVEIRDALPLAIVSESAARSLWPGENPIGKRLEQRRFGESPQLTVVGLVTDVKTSVFMESRPTIYVSAGQMLREASFGRRMFVLARTAMEPGDVERIIANIAPQALTKLHTMDGRLALTLSSRRFRATILGGFGVVALLLAAVGMYTVLSHAVLRRTRELGVRMALGARRRQLFFQVLSRALVPGVVGLGLGLTGAFAVRKILARYLLLVQPDDAPTYAAVTFILAAVVLAASAIPARRASQTDPMSALRHE